MMPRSVVVPVSGLLWSALLATSAPGVGPLAAEPPPALEGPDWRLASYRTADGLKPAMPTDGVAVVRFSGGRLSGSVGCNRLMGAYRITNDLLRFDPRIGATMMACPPAIMAREQAVIDALQQAASYRIEEDTLTVAGADGSALLTFQRHQGPGLTGTRWRLTGYNNGRGGVTTVLADTEILLQLRNDGQLAGKACNSYRGGFEQEGERLRLVGPLAATRMACPGPDGAAQESAYFAALERVARYRIAGRELTLFAADGSTQARFRAEDDRH